MALVSQLENTDQTLATITFLSILCMHKQQMDFCTCIKYSMFIFHISHAVWYLVIHCSLAGPELVQITNLPVQLIVAADDNIKRLNFILPGSNGPLYRKA